MKNALFCLIICLLLSSCDQLSNHSKINGPVHYDQLTAQKNYRDSIPGKLKIRDKYRPYRYYLNDAPYTGMVQDSTKSGSPKLIGAFKDGYAEGPWRYYQPNDSLEQEGSFADGYVTGEWRFYNKKGRENTRLFYKRNGREISADTLMVVYNDGSKKIWQKDKTLSYYPDGKIKMEMSADSSSGTLWDDAGNVLSDMKDFILTDHYTKSVTYYIAKGKNKKAYDTLLAKHAWTSKQLDDFKNANRVRVSASGFLSVSSYGFQVTLD